jgi:hypothetical protein
MAAKETNLINAEKLLAKLPKALRDESEVVEKPGKAYSLLKIPGFSTVSVRDAGVRLVHPFDGSPDDVKAVAALIEEGTLRARSEKPKEDKKSSAKKPPKGDDAPAAEGDGDKGDKGGSK